MLGVDFASFDCQPERDAAHVEMIRSLGKGEPAVVRKNFDRILNQRS
jgi:hypothetical protein